MIKTTEATGRKVFINVCGAAEVDAVGDWAGGQVGRLKTSPGRLPAFGEISIPRFTRSRSELRRVECIKSIQLTMLVASHVVFPPVVPFPQMPASVSNALQQLGSSMDPAGNEALRFPLSVGERREDADHTGAPSYVVDAIFNADVVRHLAADWP